MKRLTTRVGAGEATPICNFDICTPFIKSGHCKTGMQGDYPRHWERHCNDTCILGMMIDRLAAYEDTGLEPEEIEQLPSAWMEKVKELESIGDFDRLRELAHADQEGRLLVLDEETALAIAAGAHGCNTNKRLFGASYMRNFRSDNPQSISYYRTIEILNEIVEKALEGSVGTPVNMEKEYEP